MKLDLLWVKDPSTDKASVSLTNFVISVTFLLIAGILHMTGKVESTSLAVEYFGISAALYFSRRLNIAGKSFSSDDSKEEK